MTGENRNETGARTIPKGDSVTNHILELANVVPSTQLALDRQQCQDLVKYLELARQAGIRPDDELFLSLLPPTLVVTKYAVDAGFLFSSEHSSQLESGVRLGGRLVHSFLELLYQSSETHRDRLKIEVEAHPVTTLENNHG